MPLILLVSVTVQESIISTNTMDSAERRKNQLQQSMLFTKLEIEETTRKCNAKRKIFAIAISNFIVYVMHRK